MKKLLLILITLVCLNANDFSNKIINIIGKTEYTENRSLINYLFSNQADYYNNSKINYLQVMEKLKKNGLLDLIYKKPEEVTIIFKINKDPIKSLKIVSEILKTLGYYHYFTKELTYTNESNLTWTINLKTEAAIDPLVLSKELLKDNCTVVDIQREGHTKWMYNIDTSNSTFSKAKKLILGEKVFLRKPLKPYLLEVNDAKQLIITSKWGDHWFPKIVFYDTHLNILNIIKKREKTKELTAEIPEFTKYIKINDIFTLSNIKRGLNVLIKE